MFPYDAALLAVLEPPPATIAEVVRAMETIDATCVPGDGLKWFNWLYLAVTRRVLAGVATSGFRDPAWMAMLDVEFARLYFDALKGAISGSGGLPECWQVLFDRRGDVMLGRIQFALAGINAHINHDLPEAIVAAGGAPVHGGERYRDYCAINATLEGLVETAKTELHVRLLGDVLAPVAHLEDAIAAFSVSAAREAAWNNAEVLWLLRGTPPLVARTIGVIDGWTSVIGKTLMIAV
jgi:hypothetical protein